MNTSKFSIALAFVIVGVLHLTYGAGGDVLIKAKPTGGEHLSIQVFTNGNPAEETTPGEWEVVSNVPASVVYTAAPGYYFADGTSMSTNELNTLVSPAVNASGAVPSVAKPNLTLGVVAQRYPWSGKVDVNYQATHWPPTGGPGTAIESRLGKKVATNVFTISTGQGTVLGVTTLDFQVGGKDEFCGEAEFTAVVMP